MTHVPKNLALKLTPQEHERLVSDEAEIIVKSMRD
jgi:hypothetical protein